jgi:transposase-like protein
MNKVKILCPRCKSDNTKLDGWTRQGKQKVFCKACKHSFFETYIGKTPRATCPECCSTNTTKKGLDSRGNPAWRCKDCDHCFGEFIGSNMKKIGEFSNMEQGKDYIHIVCASRRLTTVEAVIDEYKVNMTDWYVDKHRIKTSEGYRKDRKVDWVVEGGQVISGNVKDTGKMLVVPLYHIEIFFKRRVTEIQVRANIEEMLADAKEYVPEYKPIVYPQYEAGMLYEICIPDIHFGRLTWAEESGADYDIKIAKKAVTTVLEHLLAYSKNFPVEKILLPIGNDYFNVNSKGNITVHGTVQQEDTRGPKTFRLGRRLAVEMIDQCSAVAPVDVLMITGNHDSEKLFYMGDALECWYHDNPNVTVNNLAISRKYYAYGRTLLGFTHGCDIKIDKLMSIMPLEEPHLWGQSKFREWHIGHVHHTFKLNNDVDEILGIVIRSLRSLVPADAWTFDHGFVGAVKAAESFLWDKERGLIAQLTAIP